MDFFALDDVPPEVWPHIGTALAAGFAGEARPANISETDADAIA
jgi:hypothetical protein